MNLNNNRYNSKKFDNECYNKERKQSNDINNYMLTNNKNVEHNCYQGNPEIRNQKLSDIKNTSVETELFGINRKDICDNFHTCTKDGCNTQKFDNVKENDIDECNLDTIHSRFYENNIKEMGVNRWENLKYNPQKYAIHEGRFSTNNLDTRQLSKDTYKPLDITPMDHTNELEYSNKCILSKTQSVPIHPFQNLKKC